MLLALASFISGTTASQNAKSKRPRRQTHTGTVSQAAQQNQRPVTKPQTVTREKYDTAKNETTIDVPSMLVFGEQLDGLRMFVSFSYPGRMMQAPPEVITLVLASTSTSPKYEDDNQRNLLAWADGQGLDLGAMQLFYTYRGLGYVTEGMKLAVPVKTSAIVFFFFFFWTGEMVIVIYLARYGLAGMKKRFSIPPQFFPIEKSTRSRATQHLHLL